MGYFTFAFGLVLLAWVITSPPLFLTRIIWHSLVPPRLPPSELLGGPAFDRCRIIPGVGFCEDATLWERAGAGDVVLLSCDRNRLEWNTVMGPLKNPNGKGQLFTLSPDSGEIAPIELVGFPVESDFHPLGIDVVDEDGTLLVVNHQRNESTIEVFALEPTGKARYIRTVRDEGLVAPNAITSLSPTSFIVSNDHTYTKRHHPILNVYETLSGHPLGWVSSLSLPSPSTHNLTRIPLPMSFPNGVAVSPSRDTLAVASSNLAEVLLFPLSANGTLAPDAEAELVVLPFKGDNISPAPRGDGWIVAGHPYYPSLLRYALTGGKSPMPPSWVTRVRRVEKEWEIENLFRSDGSFFGTSTTGVVVGEKLVVPGLYQEGVLLCDL